MNETLADMTSTDAPGADPSAAAPQPTDTPAAPAPAPMNAAACAEALKQRFPALFTGPAKPLKLKIVADIQAAAPGVFTRAALSAFLHRYTGSTSYLIALTRAPHRVALDGSPAGEISDEHRKVAADELQRRRARTAERRAQEDDERRARIGLLRDFERTTLTRPNFCALKGIEPDALDGLLEQARKDLEAAPPPQQQHQRPGGPGPRPGERRGPRRGPPVNRG